VHEQFFMFLPPETRFPGGSRHRGSFFGMT
jgi:hypothetical protein